MSEQGPNLNHMAHEAYAKAAEKDSTPQDLRKVYDQIVANGGKRRAGDIVYEAMMQYAKSNRTNQVPELLNTFSDDKFINAASMVERVAQQLSDEGFTSESSQLRNILEAK